MLAPTKKSVRKNNMPIIEKEIINDEEKKEVKEELFTREQLNYMISGAKEREQKKVEKNYVPRNEYEELSSKFTSLQNQIKEPKIKEVFTKIGGSKEAFGDFIKLNNNLYEVKEEKLVEELNKLKDTHKYMFNETFNATLGSQLPQSKKINNKIEFHEGTLIRKR